VRIVRSEDELQVLVLLLGVPAAAAESGET
jgi:hypothetical protein